MKSFDDFLNESQEDCTFNQESIDRLKKHLDNGIKVHSSKMRETHDPHGVYEYNIRAEVKPGQVYARLVCTQTHIQTGVEVAKNVLGFAKHDGTVYKAYTWNDPNRYRDSGSWEDLETMKNGEWNGVIK